MLSDPRSRSKDPDVESVTKICLRTVHVRESPVTTGAVALLKTTWVTPRTWTRSSLLETNPNKTWIPSARTGQTPGFRHIDFRRKTLFGGRVALAPQDDQDLGPKDTNQILCWKLGVRV